MVSINAQNICLRTVSEKDFERAQIILENYRNIAKQTASKIKQLNKKYGTKSTIHNITELVDKCNSRGEISYIKNNAKYIKIVHTVLNQIREMPNVDNCRKTQIALHRGKIFYHILTYLYIIDGGPFNGNNMISSIKEHLGIDMALTTYLKCRRNAINEFARKITEFISD